MRYLLLLIYPLFLMSAPLSVNVSAESAILVNADSGAVLYQKKAHQKMFPASVTKIATALYVLKTQGDRLDQVLTAEQECVGSVSEEAKQRSNYTLPSYWLVTDCSHMGIKKGEQLSRKDLLYGMMVASADDASNILAYEEEKDIPKFMEKLNLYLQELGCHETHFNNPHGLHHPKHVTTAYDLSIMTREALKNPFFRTLVSTVRCNRPKTNKQDPSILVQTNKLLRPGELHYKKAIGVKTGKTIKAGNTFVAAAKEGDRTLIAVLLNVKERKDIFREATLLFETAFNQPKIEKTILLAGPQKYVLELNGADKAIKTQLKENVSLIFYPAEEPSYKAFLQWDAVKLPVKAGQKVGEIVLKSNETILKRAPLLAQENVDAGWIQSIKNFFTVKNFPLFVGILCGIFFLMIAYFFARR